MKRLWNTFRYTYASLRGQILGWGLSVAGLGLLIVSFYDVIGAQSEKFEQMIASYPPEFLAFFGGDVGTLLTPAGFLKMYAFSMLPVIVGIFAVIAGSGLIASDEEHGRLDLIIAHPVGRSSFFFGRLLGLAGAVLSILLISWLGFSVMLGSSSIGYSWGQMLIPFMSLLLQLLVYITLALLLSMLLPARSIAAMVSGVVLVLSYFISSLVFLDERLLRAAKFLPQYYYQPVMDLAELNPGWVFGLLGISAAFTLLAWWRFMRRDIRVSGEGSWRFTLLAKRRQAA